MPFKPDTNISVTEYTKCGLNYVVTVGCPELVSENVFRLFIVCLINFGDHKPCL